MYTRIAAMTLAVLATACGKAPPVEPADAIWFGGPILTLADDGAQPRDAVAVKGGRIVAVGAKAEVFKAHQGRATVLHDLQGNTLLPGFVDAHSHLSGVGLQAVAANLLPPPDGRATSIAGIQQIMRDSLATAPFVKQYGLAIGFNYDDSQLAERRAPNRQELDTVSSAIPIVLTHQSGHLGAYNSKALAMAGITAASPDPAGGVIQRESDGRTPNGVLEEQAHFSAMQALMPHFTAGQAMDLVTAAQEVYLANGYTTVQDGRTDATTLAVLAAMGEAGKLKVDVVAYPDLPMNAKNAMLTGPLMARAYTDRFRIGGIKLSFDGSPQGKTAWFTKPYKEPPVGQAADYRGYPAFPEPGEAQGWVDMAYKNHWQVLVHANGDAAIDELIATVANAQRAHPGADRRTVLIHGQYLRPDQVEKIKALGIFPALYPMHTFYWGDYHRDSVAGAERAAFISPTGAVLAVGMRFSIQSDAPVTYPDSMRILDSAVNRTTRSQRVLGPDQRVSPEVALKAMTLWPAYQHFEETDKGSIEVGKLADFVVLDRNPLAVARATLKDIEVLATVKEGREVWPAQHATKGLHMSSTSSCTMPKVARC